MSKITLYAVLAAVLLPFVGAFVAPVLHRWLGERLGYFAALVAFVSFGLVTWVYVGGESGVHGIDWINAAGYEIQVSFLVDGLSLLMGFIASGIGVLIMVYARGYMHGEEDQGRFFAYMLAFMGSMLGVVFSDNIISLFVFWELTSLTSFLLIGFYFDEEASVYGARKSMIITVTGGLFMLIGFLMLYAVTGTFSLEAMMSEENVEAVLGSSMYIPILALVGLGAATKSAQFPFHIWLPNAMEAPTPVSAFLHSATMVKAGVFLIGRFTPILSGREEWVFVFGTLGLVTMLIGAVLAVGSEDVKELLAYSTMSHLGLIIGTFGFAGVIEVGGEAGTFHILNHATFKATLFMVAGIVAHSVGSRKLSDLGGLRKHLPLTAGLALIASLSMAGVPPFNGFYSKEFLYEAALEMTHEFDSAVFWFYPVVAVVGSVFTFLYSIRFFHKIFMGDETEYIKEHDVHSPLKASVIPPTFLVVVIAVISINPQIAADAIVTDGIDAVLHGHGQEGHTKFHPHLPTKLTNAFIMSLITIGLGIVSYTQYGRMKKGLRSLYRRAPPTTVNYYYDGFLSVSSRLSKISVDRIETGYLRTYVAWLLAGTASLAITGYLAGNVDFTLPEGLETATLPLVSILVLTMLASVVVPFARSHVSGLLTLSIVGFAVGIFYVIAAAPDLAITQIVVETITLVVFLLVLERLPAFYIETPPLMKMGRDLLLSALVGVTVFVTVIAARSGSPDPIRDILLESSVPEGGGHNVVNVILVDFRGFDTLGEITVVAMAAVGVITLIAMRGRGGTETKTGENSVMGDGSGEEDREDEDEEENGVSDDELRNGGDAR